MNYLAYYTTGNILTVDSVSRDISTSLTFDGNNYLTYGQEYWDNLVHLTENFSSPYTPRKPIKGQIWYDNINKTLKLYNSGWHNLQSKDIDTSIYCKKTGDKVNTLVVTPTSNIATRKYIEDAKLEFKTPNYIIYDNKYMIYYISVSSNSTVKLPVSMIDTNYSVIATFNSIVNKTGTHINISDKTKTSFTVSALGSIDTIAVIVMGFSE